MTSQVITRGFETSGGHAVTVTGKLINSSIKFDITVSGFGSQGGAISRANFSKNGIDYAGIVGKLPLTQEQMDIIDEMRQELMVLRNEYEKSIDQECYGTYEEVQIKHPWMKNTF